MQVARTRADLAAALVDAPAGDKRGFVPTMGALHAGHMSLVELARREAGPGGFVVVSIFVNPLQFGPNEDFAAYPRPLDADLELLRGAGVDLVWAPSEAEMYPPGEPIPWVEAGPAGDSFEGAARPGHFTGVLTVVNLLFDQIRPGFAIFGEKDFQQISLVRRLARQRGDVRIVGAPLVRDSDGLAQSSRNAFLSVDDRRRALAIPHAIWAAQRVAMQGGTAAAALAAANEMLAEARAVEPAYVAIVNDELEPVTSSGRARILIAARVGGVRLLDNAALDLRGDN